VRGRRHRAMLNSAVDFAIIATDRDGRITDWNSGAERILGWVSADVLGQPADLIFTPEDRAEDRQGIEMRTALHDGRASDERWHMRQDGTRFWASGETMPLRDGSAHLGFLKILRDRTEQRQAAEAQRVEAEFLRGVLASSGDCIKVLDLDARLVFMTEAGQRAMEVGDFNIIRGCPWPDFWPDQGNLDAKAAVAAAKAGGVGHFQGAAPTMAGTPRHWDVQVTPILGADGRPERLLSISRDITAAKAAEERLRNSEDNYRYAVDLSPQTVWTARPDGQLDHVGARWQEWTGTSGLGSSWGEVVHPEDLEPTVEAWTRAVATGERYDIEHRVRMLNGAHRWMHSRAYPRYDGEGRIARWYGLTEDIHAGRAAESALYESEARFRNMADHAPVMMWTTNPSGSCTYLNRRWYEFTGQTEAEALGLEWTQATHPDDRAPAEQAFLSANAAQKPFEVEYRLRRSDRAYRWAVDAATPRFGEDGAFLGYVGSVTDITDRKQAVDAQRALNETLEQQVAERTRDRDRVWRNSRDLLVIIGADGLFRAVNPAWAAILGQDPAEVVGQSFQQFIWPEDAALTQDALSVAAAQHDLTSFENRYRHKDGTPRWISWHTTAEGDVIYAYGRDITAEKEQAAALAAAEQALRQSQKMEAVGQLTGGLAHDFNNLLAGISGSLELMQTRVAQGRINDLERYIMAAQGASKRAAALTHRLLAFTRQQTLDPKPTDVNRLVAGMEELVRRTVGPSVGLEVVGAAGLWPVLVDPNQLENALLNLCINARDAMPDGGRLTIETGNKWLDDRAARSRDLPAGQYVSLCVSDTGTGMTPEVARRAFDPFFTTKPIGMGTGLGLSMIYGFVQQSGGQARIYSEPGQGAMVCLYLPRHHGEATSDGIASELSEAPRAQQGETVLVVDDEPTVRMLVAEVLQDLGYTAIEAADGQAGLKVLRSDVHLDLLVTDVGLPGGMNGRQVADVARVARPGLKVLFITGYAENAVLSHGHLDPGMHVLTKPFALETLASRIKDLIAGA